MRARMYNLQVLTINEACVGQLYTYTMHVFFNIFIPLPRRSLH